MRPAASFVNCVYTIKLHNNLRCLVYHLLRFFHMRPASESTITNVALCHKKVLRLCGVMKGSECVRRYLKFNLFLPTMSNLRVERRPITCSSIQHDVIFQKKEKRKRGVGWRNKICHALSIPPPPTHFSQNIHVYTRCVRLTFWFVSMVTRRIDLLWSLAGNCAVLHSQCLPWACRGQWLCCVITRRSIRRMI